MSKGRGKTVTVNYSVENHPTTEIGVLFLVKVKYTKFNLPPYCPVLWVSNRTENEIFTFSFVLGQNRIKLTFIAHNGNKKHIIKKKKQSSKISGTYP